MAKTLIVVAGATGSGKTDLAIAIAKRVGCDIISADSRQMFRDIPIGTAAPSAEQLAEVRHHFVGTLRLGDYYSAARYEEDVMALLPELWEQSDVQVMCGGSMMYIDAVTHGIDDLPTISERVRADVKALYERGGVELIRSELASLDPVYYEKVDKNNIKRLMHAVEICLESGVAYSTLCTGQGKPRDFKVVKVAWDYDRDKLFDRINRRVDAMMAAGLLDEARSVYHLRELNSLNTVGYKELFAYMDGEMDLPTAVARIGKNTRVYAKKQLLWLSKDPNVIKFKPATPIDEVMAQITDAISMA